MKKTVYAVLAIVVCLCMLLCGCGKKNEKIKVSISTASLSQEELADLDKFAADNGFESAKYNQKDEVIEVVLSDIEHDKLTYSLGVAVIRNVYGMINSKRYPFIKNIERNSNFTDMTIYVKQSSYEKSGKSDEIMDFVGNYCLLYLEYEDIDREDKKCTVRIADNKTGLVLNEKVYAN